MPVLSAALSDIGDTDSPLPGLERIESSSRARVASVLVNTLRSVHSHKQIYGDHWSIQEFIDAPARDVFNWHVMSSTGWPTPGRWRSGRSACAVFGRPMSRGCGAPTTSSPMTSTPTSAPLPTRMP